MNIRQRIYDGMVREHLRQHKQMAFISGPRQVGKTTLCRALSKTYFNWDQQDHRDIILRGPNALIEAAGLQKASAREAVVVLDELHRYARWKTFLKGLYDVHGDDIRFIVTGSSRLDVFRRGGDSLMGRYFHYHMHPFSAAEAICTDLPTEKLIRPARPVPDDDWKALWTHGGFPDPFLKRDARFTRRWQTLREAQLLRGDVRDLTRILELDQLAALAQILKSRSGSQIIYSSLAQEVRVSENTIRAWVGTLASLHFGFLVRPWHKNVTNAIRKEPKWFLRDWSIIEDEGQRVETLTACHLLKAVEGWTDLGWGQFDLWYIRDKQKREIDFLVTRDRKPWFLVEAKRSDTSLTPNLALIQKSIGAQHAFQAVFSESHVETNCFKYTHPVVTPLKTLLSQLL